MAVSNKKLVEWATRYRQQLESLSDEASQILEGGITSSWSSLVDDVARFYRRAQDGSGQYSLSEAVKRLEQVNSIIKDWLPAKSPELKDLTRQFAKSLQQSERLGLKFGAQIKKLVYPDSEISQLSAPNFKAVLEAATGIADRMWRYNEDLRIRSGQAVVNSLVRGQSAAGLARQLREFVQQPISGINRIARTELASAYVKSSQRSYEEDGVEYGQWAAVESLRTCPYCAARHMHVYKLSDIIIPAHPNCLCSILPVSKERLDDEDFQQESWEEQQAILKELEASGRQPIASQTPFEKYAGLIPPQPVWQPFDPATLPPPPPPAPTPDPAPRDLGGWPPAPDSKALKAAKAKATTVAGIEVYDFSAGDQKKDGKVFTYTKDEAVASAESRDALLGYQSTYDGYTPMQKALRDGAELKGKYAKSQQALDALFETAALPVNTLLYRGLAGKFAESLTEQLMAGTLAEGTVLSDPAFVSTTLSRSRGESFAQGGVVLKIAARAGSKAVPVNGLVEQNLYSQEREVLLPRNATIRIMGGYRNAKTGITYLECVLDG